MVSGISIRGIEKIVANMEKATKAIERAAGGSVRDAAMLVEREAKINAPVNKLRKGGRLRSSIGAEEKNPLLYEVGTNVEYAGFVEFGTYKMAAQPYLQPAVETARREFPILISDAIKREI